MLSSFAANHGRISMFVTLVEKIDDLTDLEPEIRAIGVKSPMLQPDWLSEWWRFYGRSESGGSAPQLLLLAIRNAEHRLTGLAPLFVNGGREVQFLGSGKVCSDHLSILCREGDQLEVTQSVVDWLFDEAHGRQIWQAIDLEAIDRDDAAMQAFITAIRNRPDALVTCRPDTGSWSLELPGTWEDYLNRLSKGRRKRCRKWHRDFFETGRAKLTKFSTAEQLEEGFDKLELLHNRRRRYLGDLGAFEDPTFRQFHRSAARKLVETQSLYLTCLEIDGKPTAAEYCLVGGETVYAYQSGIEPDLLGLSPGHLSVMVSLRSAIEEGFRFFDFMRGDESYKSNWGAQPRPALRLRVWQRNVTGRLQQLVETARQSSKPVVSKLKSLVD